MWYYILESFKFSNFFWSGIAATIYFTIVLGHGIFVNKAVNIRYNDGLVYIVHSILMASYDITIHSQTNKSGE